MFSRRPRHASGSLPTWSMRPARLVARRAASAGDDGTTNSSSGSSATWRAKCPDHASTSLVSTSCRSIVGACGRKLSCSKIEDRRLVFVEIAKRLDFWENYWPAHPPQKRLADGARSTPGRQIERYVGEIERPMWPKLLHQVTVKQRPDQRVEERHTRRNRENVFFFIYQWFMPHWRRSPRSPRRWRSDFRR